MKRSLDDIQQFLKNLKIDEVNEMQQAAMDVPDITGDFILSAPTGSGKTVAFLLMLLRAMPVEETSTFGMIITPTRELALQITSVFQSMKTGYKVTTCYGGHKREIEENNLIESPALIVGTPGRICDHIRRGNIKVDDIRMLILDEFDKSLEMGFLEEMEFIHQSLPDLESKILVSATAETKVPQFLLPDNPKLLDFSDITVPRIALNRLQYPDYENKRETLLNALCTIGNRRTIIFANLKETVEGLLEFLASRGISAVAYHGSMEQQDRETSITKFRNGTSLFLVTTDLASRGLDISHVRYIIHFDLPETEQIFVHRNGRTARMEATGDAIIMVQKGDTLPDFIPGDTPEFNLVPERPIPDRTEWGTIFISAGKKDKVNKMDIAGFLMKDAGLKQEDTGLIEIKDFYSFAAVRRVKMNELLGRGRYQRIKKKKVLITAAK